MSRYIDAKWLEDNAKEYSLGYYDYDEYAVPLSALDFAPTIDIVRCKECKYGEIWTDGVYTNINCINGVIGGYGAELDPDDFCSYGEREGE